MSASADTHHVNDQHDKILSFTGSNTNPEGESTLLINHIKNKTYVLTPRSDNKRGTKKIFIITIKTKSGYFRMECKLLAHKSLSNPSVRKIYEKYKYIVCNIDSDILYRFYR